MHLAHGLLHEVQDAIRDGLGSIWLGYIHQSLIGTHAMVDDERSSPGSLQQGHQIGVNDFLRDVVRLMAFVQAGPNVSCIWRGPERDPDAKLERFQQMVEGHLITEIPRLLISVAAVLRAKIDDGSWRVDDDEYVGWISDGDIVQQEWGQAVSVREACNKIIHAKRVQPDHVTTEDGVQSISTIVTIFGDRRGKAWAAELNLQTFCIALANTDFYAHESWPED